MDLSNINYGHIIFYLQMLNGELKEEKPAY